MKPMNQLLVRLSALCVALLFSVTAFAQSAVNVGIVDLQFVLNTVEQGQQARTQLEADFERRQGELQTQQGELEAFARELEASLPMMTQEAQMERAQEYQRRVMELQEAFARNQSELQAAEAEITGQIFERMQAIVALIAEERGYTMVLDKSTVIYIAQGNEFTAEVVQRYDAAY